MSTSVLVAAGSVILAAAAVEGLTFMALYHVASRGAWRHDPMGRHIMAFVGVDATVFTLATVRVLGGASLDTSWFVWVRLLSLLGIPWVIGWRIAILWRLYRRHGNDSGGVV